MHQMTGIRVLSLQCVRRICLIVENYAVGFVSIDNFMSTRFLVLGELML